MTNCVISVDEGDLRGKIRKAELETRSATTDAVEPKRKIDGGGAMDTSGAPHGKRNRATVDAVENSDEYHGNRETRRRVGNLHLAVVVGKEVGKRHAPGRNHDLMARWDATHASAAEGVDGASSARIAEERNRVLGQERNEEEGKLHGSVASAAEEGALSAREKFMVSAAVGGRAPSKPIVDARRVLTWEMVRGEKECEGSLRNEGLRGS